MALVNRGDIYWLQPEAADDAIPHPYVVVQDDALNHSRLETVVVCALTSNLKRASLPGNVLLEAGEGSLPKQSVVEVSKISSVAKSQLGAYIGTLSQQRVEQIFAGLRFLQRSFFAG
jgi:mRNA interferase MazF